MAMMYVSVGLMIGYLLSSYLDYYLVPCIAIAVPVVYLVAIFGLSETPQYLLRRGRDEQAKKSYCFYKNLTIAKPDGESAHDDSTEREFATFKQQVLSGGVRQDIVWKDFCKLDTDKTLWLLQLCILCMCALCLQLICLP